MFNKTNLIGWSNLAFRLLLSFGLIFFVQNRYGASNVKSWLVYITLIASIQAADGLISQYFMREILHAHLGGSSQDLNRCLRRQRNIYLALALVFAAVAYFSMGGDTGIALVASIYAFTALKMFDSRARAHLEVQTFQKLELMLNIALLIILGIALFQITHYRSFLLVHITALTFGVVMKGILSGRKKERQDDMRALQVPSCPSQAGLWQSLVIAFGGTLSVNIALLALQSLIGGAVSASYLLTYRIGALICEASSTPLIIRMPEITRNIAQQKYIAMQSAFRKNYRLAMLLCVIGFFFINVASHIWNRFLPVGLHLETGIMLAIISVGWIFERVASLSSQLLLSLKNYEVTWAYGAYLVLGIGGLALACEFRAPLLFSSTLMVSNIFVAAVVRSRRKGIRVE